MNFKKIVTTFVAGASMLCLAGMASAATTSEVNIYGASAQYLYWSSEAPNFVANQGYTVSPWTATKDSKNMISVGSKANGDMLIVRVSSKASYDGILALKGNTTDPNRVTECEGTLGATYRKMVDESSCTGSTCTATKCVKVTNAASDVEGESFVQSSTGKQFGPSAVSPNPVITRAFSALDTTGLTDVRKIVVPFAFFANNGVTNNGTPITNLSRMQAVQIFSGQAWYWADLGIANANPITVCLRHAGSGTMATLDLGVMHGSWGGPLVAAEHISEPTVWFNDGTPDELNCLAQFTNAVGYADADQTMAGVNQLTYNGVAATYATIANGDYDNFWSVQNCYYLPTNSLAAAACNFVDHIPTSKSAWWAKSCEMTFMKDHDNQYPHYVGSTCSH